MRIAILAASVLLVLLPNTVPAEEDFNLHAARTFPCGGRPFSLARGDYDGDGIDDLAVANHDDNRVSILIGNGNAGVGDGTFLEPVPYPTTNTPRYVLAADFNEDAILDLAVTHIDTNRVAVLIGNGTGGVGDGTFAAAVLYEVQGGSTWLAAGDFNSDDILDLAVANLWGGHISILIGQGSGGVGDGTFQPHVDYPAGSSPNCVITEDFDSDGILDLAVADMVANAVRIFLGGGEAGQGDGTFSLSVSYDTPSATACVIADDFDGDGILDLAASSYFANLVSILMGNGSAGQGDGTFQARVDYPAGNGPPALTSGDFNEDTEIDLAVVNYHGDAAAILFGDGDGTFGDPVLFPVGDGPELLLVGDYNEDGVPDLASANALSDNVSILLGLTGDEAGTFRTARRIDAGIGPMDVIACDFNEDGFPDLAIADSLYDRVRVLIADGTGNGFLPKTSYPAGISPIGLAAGDFDADDIEDLAVADYFGDCVQILFGNGSAGVGDGTFQSPVSIPAGNGPRAVLTADFDEDEILDLATANFPNRAVIVLHGIGGGAFDPPVIYSVGDKCRDLVVGDFNADDVLDLAATTWENGDVAVLLGNGLNGVGDGTFQSPVRHSAGSSPAAITFGHFDADSIPDLAVACEEVDSLSILAGNGNGTFQAPLRITAHGNPRDLSSADLDGDGRADLVLANRSTCNLSVWKGEPARAARTFLPREDFGVGQSPSAVIACDLNRDNLIDLVTADEIGGTVSVLFNISSDPTTSIADLPDRTSVRGDPLRPFPNPLAPEARILFSMENNGICRVSVFDVEGRLIRKLVDRRLDGGDHEVFWDGRDHRGVDVPPGIYLCRVQTPAGIRSGKMLVVR